jgi:hypothetical protein
MKHEKCECMARAAVSRIFHASFCLHFAFTMPAGLAGGIGEGMDLRPADLHLDVAS